MNDTIHLQVDETFIENSLVTIELIIAGRRYTLNPTAEELSNAYYLNNHLPAFDYANGWPSKSSMNLSDRL